ncbi:MAG TPA: hypothetical protein VJ521_05145 [Acidobacteriota bacterium]|nr:hypothetical protein [Acidobacteriota bacterium]
MTKPNNVQRNVTLRTDATPAEHLQGKPFPCPVCMMPLPIELSQKQKPYCTCNHCGLQLFIRGKTGIRRLQELLQAEEALAPETTINTHAVTLYNRLAELKQQREELESRQGVFFRDRDLDNAIAALDGEIKRVQLELARVRKEAEKKR